MKYDNKVRVFEIGKSYIQDSKYSKWYIMILSNKFMEYQGITIKESRFENYINFDSDIFQEPKEVKEISKIEFLAAKNRVLALLEQRLSTVNCQLSTDNHQPSTNQ